MKLKRALMFISSAARSELKPECISPQIEQQCAQAVASAGSEPGLRRARGDIRQSPGYPRSRSCRGSAGGHAPDGASREQPIDISRAPDHEPARSDQEE